jgi:hypothetical protein
MKPRFFFASSDIVVIDLNPEMADYDNPRGELYGYATYVIAEDEWGHRCRLYVETLPRGYGERRAMESADRMAKALIARLQSGRLPVAFDRWEPITPAYGSHAYIEEGGEDDLIEWERRMDEEYA